MSSSWRLPSNCLPICSTSPPCGAPPASDALVPRRYPYTPGTVGPHQYAYAHIPVATQCSPSAAPACSLASAADDSSASTPLSWLVLAAYTHAPAFIGVCTQSPFTLSWADSCHPPPRLPVVGPHQCLHPVAFLSVLHAHSLASPPPGVLLTPTHTPQPMLTAYLRTVLTLK